MKPWMIDAKAFEYDRHYSDCKKSNHPFIKARKNLATNEYLVFLDMATCNPKLSQKEQKKLHDVFSSEVSSDAHCEITEEFCNFDGILPQKLDRFLAKLYETAKR